MGQKQGSKKGQRNKKTSMFMILELNFKFGTQFDI